MSKKVIVICSVAALIIVGVGVVHFRAQKEAEDRVKDLVYSTDIFEDVDYENVSYNIFTGTTSISNVTTGNEYSSIESIEILKADFEDGVDLHIAVNNSRTNLVDSFRDSFPENNVHDLRSTIGLVAIGVREEVVNMDLRFLFDPDKKEIALDVLFSDGFIGSGNADLLLTNVSERLFDQLTDTARALFDDVEKSENINLEGALAMLEKASRVGVSNIELGYEDTGNIRQLLRLAMLDEGLQLDEESEEEYQEVYWESRKREIAQWLEVNNVPSRMINEWMEKVTPDTKSIKVTTDIKRPIKIEKLVGALLGGDVSGVVKMLDVDVEV